MVAIRWRSLGVQVFGAVSCALLVCGAAKAAVSEEVTYTRQIAAILWKNCAGCHRPGEVGPFSLLTYQDAFKRADFIAEITATRRMPPWKAEPDFGKFQDERRLSKAEIALVAKWAKAGAPEGDPKELPKPPEYSEGWQLGEPDLVLKMSEPFSIPASGRDVYRCFVIPIPTEKDRMVSGVEFRPGNRKVVHHAILYLDANGQGRQKDGADGKPGFLSFGGPGITPTGGLGSWVPGATPRFLPDGIVKYVKKGSDLVMQIHYHPSGKPETDESIVGVYFSKKAARKIVTGIAVLQPKLNIPPDEKHHEVTAQSEALPVDVNVMGISPHMHNLGREFKVVATRPGSAEEVPLIWIKDWDFNWQGAYQFAQPVRLPKGSSIKVHAVYDNSSENSKNPNNPPKPVHWGEQTTDEMCLCGVQVFADTISDLKKVAAMRGNELGAGLDGGVPGLADAVKKAATKKIAAAKSKDSKQASSSFPTGGFAIPERFRTGLAPFDSDNDGKLSREEAEKMPVPAQQRLQKMIQLNQTANGK
ncbi:MAG: ascorbate-dependent monooxygenase [Planctomycetia bacterium]|nr:ascorbate-dependent monooxygenase [Planctomycetia bacterium]